MNDNNKTNWIISIILSLLFSFSISYKVDQPFIWMNFLLVSIFSLILIKYVFDKVSNITINNKKEEITKNELYIYGVLISISLLVAIIIFHPGITTSDTLHQLNQVRTNLFSNWHPLIQTFLFIKVPYTIYGNIISCTLFQCIFIGCILFYLCIFLRKNYFNRNQMIICLLFIILNPTFCYMSVYLLSATSYSWMILLTTILIMKIVLTKGEWINNKTNKQLFIISILGVLFFNHNGIICVSILLLSILLCYKKDRKFYLLLWISLILSRMILYGPVYNFLGIEKAGGKNEMVGIPVYQISYMYHNNHIKNEKDIELLNELAPKETWEEKYDPVSINTLRWSIEDNNYYEWVCKNYNKIIKLWIRNGLSHPNDMITSYLNITSTIWKINNYTELSWGDLSSLNPKMQKVRKIFYDYCETISNSPLKYVLFNLGISLFIIIFSLGITIKKAKNNYEKYLPFVLVLSNTILLMFIIAGGEIRMIYSQQLCVIPLLIYSIGIENNKIVKDKQKKKEINRK